MYIETVYTERYTVCTLYITLYTGCRGLHTLSVCGVLSVSLGWDPSGSVAGKSQHAQPLVGSSEATARGFLGLRGRSREVPGARGKPCPPMPCSHSTMQCGEDAPPKAKHQEHRKEQEKGAQCLLTCAQLRFLLVKW